MAKARRRWILTTVLGLTGAGISLAAFWPQPMDVDVADVRRGPITETVADQGTARVRQAYVVAAPVSGQVDRLSLEVGDRVVAGQTIVAYVKPVRPELLDARTRAQAQSAIDAASAALDSAKAQRDRLGAEAAHSHTELERVAMLERQDIETRQALDNAQATADQAEHALRAAEADIVTRRANLASAQAALTTPTATAGGLIAVTSPASGVVTRLWQQSERTVAPGTPIIEIGATAGLEAAIEFLTQDAVRIRPGQRAEIYDWGGPANISAEVRLVEPQGFTKVSALGVEEQRTLVILQFTGAPAAWTGLAPGYRVWGRVVLRDVPSAILAPLGALVRDDGDWAIYRVEHGRTQLRRLQVGVLTDRDAEILSGLAPGDEVVVYPSDLVHNGLRVRARPSQGP